MRVPQISKKKNWQIFLSGVTIGGCISWLIFIYMFGVLQEEQTNIIERQKADITDLKSHISIWQEEFKKLNKKNQEMLTVQKVEVKITNFDRYKIEDSHSIFEVEEMIKEDLNVLLAKDLNTVYQNKDLIKKTIENKTVKINDKRYNVKVKEIYFFTKVQIYLELRLAT
ncbi:ABC-type antimicrobial peptide transport system permease subunit [Oikeobacillus pervagus]|uniref:ABC-type antimicrobial peptide transport system permease subunit n=1 Tax=Oikeobacillus pervagus TaxID=1325931 RepID=A0AAJ1T304_9BACI|nr:sporulation membrane protein YtrI [Oikeobacillus pervagus]MDQ0214989.1 ABC-type antimicrobial peptide transport system permease subunit [Oikeobacillus pervagus]